MPTTIDRFFGVVQLCQNLATMQNNMRANVQIIQAGVANPASELFEDYAKAQTAIRALGAAFLQRLDMNAAVVTAHSAEVQAGSTALGISFTDMTDVYNLLRTSATNLSAATVTNQTQLDNGVNAILTNVPAAMLPF